MPEAIQITTRAVLLQEPGGTALTLSVATPGQVWKLIDGRILSGEANGDGHWIKIQSKDEKAAGWLRKKYTKAVPWDSQEFISEIIRNDLKSIANLKAILIKLAQRRKKGGKVNAWEKLFVKSAISRMRNRQMRLAVWARVQGAKIQLADAGFTRLLDEFMESQDKGLGNPAVAVAWALVALGLVTIVGTVVLYEYFGPAYEESGITVEKTEAYLKIISNDSPADIEKFEKEMNNQLNDAFNKGKKKQWAQDFGGTIKWTLIAAVGLFTGVKVSQAVSRKNQTVVIDKK